MAAWSLTVLDGVLDGAQAIPHGIFDLREGVLVGPLYQQRDRVRVATLLHKCVLLLPLPGRAERRD